MKIAPLRKYVSRIVARRLAARAARIADNVVFDGLPIITSVAPGAISIGANSNLVSTSRGTLLGVRSPCIFRALTPAATIQIGENCAFSGTVICAAIAIKIGANSMFGADVMIFDTDFHEHDPVRRRHGHTDWSVISKPTIIGEDVFVGARATILKGVTIGDGAMVGSGSVVTANVEPYQIVAGVPARVIGKVPRT